MNTLSVLYVHEVYADMNDPILRKLKEYCDHMNIDLRSSFYNVDSRSEDRHYIERLPAIHLYVNGGYEDTVYPDTRPIQVIQSMHGTLELKNLEYLAKKQIWEERIRYVKSIFKSKKRIFESQPIEHM